MSLMDSWRQRRVTEGQLDTDTSLSGSREEVKESQETPLSKFTNRVRSRLFGGAGGGVGANSEATQRPAQRKRLGLWSMGTGEEGGGGGGQRGK